MQDMLAALPDRLNPKFMLIASRAIAAARPALIAFLIVQGVALSGGMAHPISFCNILFVGNLSAACFVSFWFGLGKILQTMKSITPIALLGLCINGVLATLLSSLIFLGLRTTTVTNAVLLGRLGPVLFALAGALILGKKIKRMEWFGFSLIAVGVVAIALKTSGYRINQGDLLILLSTVVFALSSLVNKLMISRSVPLSVVVFSRNFISAVIFFIIAIRIFGPHHFGDAFSGRLWIIMGIYALIVIVCSQLLWYAAINRLDSREIGRLTVLSPIFGVFYAFLLNGERPSQIQVMTLVLVIVGVFISSLGKTSRPDMDMMMPEPENAASAP